MNNSHPCITPWAPLLPLRSWEPVEYTAFFYFYGRCQALILISGSRNFLGFNVGHYLLTLPTCSLTVPASIWAKSPDEARKQNWLLPRKPHPLCPFLWSGWKERAEGCILLREVEYSKLHLKHSSFENDWGASPYSLVFPWISVIFVQHCPLVLVGMFLMVLYIF